MRRAIGLIGLLVAIALVGGCWLFSPPSVTPPTVVTPPELRTVTFEQVDWYEADGTIVQANSLYGLMSWTYEPDLRTTFFLNVRAALTPDDDGGWVIRNLPLFAADDANTSARREATYFTLADLGLVFDSPAELVVGIDVGRLYVSISVDNEILNDFPADSTDLVDVGTVKHWATGLADESPLPGPFADPGEPEGIKVEGVATRVNGARDVRGVQEEGARCAAGAFARSLDWLNREHDLGMQKNAQQIYRELIAAGVSEPNDDNTPARDEWIARKDEYAREQTDGRIVTKVWDRGTTVELIEGVTEETGDFAEWLKREIRTEDVEVAYYYPGNAHIVTVLEVYTRGGHLYVKYRDDEHQGNNARGDTAVKHAKIYKVDGEYRFGADRNRIYFAVSESVAAEAPPEEN